MNDPNAFHLYVNVQVMKGDTELAATTAGEGDDVVSIAKELVEHHSLTGYDHIQLEIVLEKGDDIHYTASGNMVSKHLRIPFTER